MSDETAADLAERAKREQQFTTVDPERRIAYVVTYGGTYDLASPESPPGAVLLASEQEGRAEP